MEAFFKDFVGACCTPLHPNGMGNHPNRPDESKRNSRRAYEPERRDYWQGSLYSTRKTSHVEQNRGNFERAVDSNDGNHLPVVLTDRNSNSFGEGRPGFEKTGLSKSRDITSPSAGRDRELSIIQNFRVEDQTSPTGAWKRCEPKISKWPSRHMAAQSWNGGADKFACGVQDEGWSMSAVESHGRQTWEYKGLVPSTQMHTSGNQCSSHASTASTSLCQVAAAMPMPPRNAQ
jgi:hypothetical protein